MIPKIDIKNVLGGLPAITNADNVYAELADSQGKIGQSDLTSMILKKSNYYMGIHLDMNPLMMIT